MGWALLIGGSLALITALVLGILGVARPRRAFLLIEAAGFAAVLLSGSRDDVLATLGRALIGPVALAYALFWPKRAKPLGSGRRVSSNIEVASPPEDAARQGRTPASG